MSPPVNGLTLAVMAAIGIGMGIYYLVNHLNEEEPLRYRPGPPPNNPRRMRNSSPPKQTRRIRHSSPPNNPRQIRHSSPLRRPITPPNVTCQASQSLPPQVVPTRSDGLHRRTRKPVADCEICMESRSVPTMTAECGHLYHRECYTIWKATMDALDLDKICPQCCRGSVTQSL